MQKNQFSFLDYIALFHKEKQTSCPGLDVRFIP